VISLSILLTADTFLFLNARAECPSAKIAPMIGNSIDISLGIFCRSASFSAINTACD